MAMLRPAYEMKDSGIEWMGSIPQNWGIIKNKYLLHKMYSGGTPKATDDSFYVEDGIPFVSISDMSTTDYVYETKKHLSEAGLKDKNLKVLDEGTILYSIYATIGAVSELRIKATISQAMLALSLKVGYHKDYYKYNLHAMRESIFALSNGNTQFNLNAEKVWNFTFVKPSLSEQQAIADYLDDRCSKIDEIIAEATASIEEYKELKQAVIFEAVTKGLDKNVPMKDSGNELIGSIPESWNCPQLKFLCKTQGRIGFKGYTVSDQVGPGEGAIVLGATHMLNGRICLEKPVYLSWEKYFESPEIMTHKDDLLIVQRGSTIGKVALVDKDYGCVTINPSLVLIKNTRIDSKYLLYALSATSVMNYIRIVGYSTAIPMVSQKQINAISIPVPSSENEIKEIVDYLDKETNMIDKIIEEKEKCLFDLKQYKKSLIYEVVTGKKRVIV